MQHLKTIRGGGACIQISNCKKNILSTPPPQPNPGYVPDEVHFFNCPEYYSLLSQRNLTPSKKNI